MLARAAQNGQGIVLKPDDCSDNDIPWDFQMAVDQAYRIISWLDNLPKKEMPPQWMWPFDEKIIEWFNAVNSDRNGGISTDESKNLVQNDFAKGRGKDS